MDDRITELTVRRMVERLATRDPVPGGGSAAALAGAMGAALVRMVVELTSGVVSDSSDELAEIGRGATTWQSELLNLAEIDAAAYSAVVRAQKLPRSTEIEAQARAVQIAAAIREATRAPLETMRGATAVLGLAEQLAPLGSRHAVSDVGVAGMLATSAARGAALNVRINLPHLKDEELRREALGTLDELGLLADRERALSLVIEGRMA